MFNFKIINQNIPGVSGEYIYERIYPYDELLRSILGSTGKISRETKSEYLSNDYSLSDTVGISYLEKEYEKKGVSRPKDFYGYLTDENVEQIKSGKTIQDLFG